MLSSKISEVCGLGSNQYSYVDTMRNIQLQTEMFCKPTHEAFQNNPHYQLIQINLQENLLKSLLVNLFSRNIRKSIPTEQWGKYLISSQNMEYVGLFFSTQAHTDALH